MKNIIGLLILSLIIFACCPLADLIQEAFEGIQDTLSDIDVRDYIDSGEPEISVLEEPISVEPEGKEPFIPQINPCEGIYEKYPHDPTLGEIKGDYVGSWHASPFVSDAYNERFVLFSSGNYLFFPSQYECEYSSDEACVLSTVEDGLWGVQGEVMNFAKGGDLNNLISRSITPTIPSSADESPYPYKTTIDGLPFWLMAKEPNLWDPQTGELCDL